MNGHISQHIHRSIIVGGGLGMGILILLIITYLNYEVLKSMRSVLPTLLSCVIHNIGRIREWIAIGVYRFRDLKVTREVWKMDTNIKANDRILFLKLFIPS